MIKKSVEKQKTQKDEAKYEKQIRNLESEVRRLKNELKTAKEALAKTDDYLIEMTKDKSVAQVIKDVKDHTDIIVQEKCPKCGTNEMKKINLGAMKLIVCTRCDYRNRVNAGNQPAETT